MEADLRSDAHLTEKTEANDLFSGRTLSPVEAPRLTPGCDAGGAEALQARDDRRGLGNPANSARGERRSDPPPAADLQPRGGVQAHEVESARAEDDFVFDDAVDQLILEQEAAALAAEEPRPRRGRSTSLLKGKAVLQ